MRHRLRLLTTQDSVRLARLHLSCGTSMPTRPHICAAGQYPAPSRMPHRTPYMACVEENCSRQERILRLENRMTGQVTVDEDTSLFTLVPRSTSGFSGFSFHSGRVRPQPGSVAPKTLNRLRCRGWRGARSARAKG